MTSASDEKWRPFNCFFQSGRAKDLLAPLYKSVLGFTVIYRRYGELSGAICSLETLVTAYRSTWYKPVDHGAFLTLLDVDPEDECKTVV